MKDKQIEEMAKVMLEASTNANVEPVLEMEGKEVVLGENATKVLNNILEQAFIPFLAKTLYNAGYRKASEVAKEFRQRMNEKMGKHTHLLGKEYVQRVLREIEKEFSEVDNG